MPGHGKVGFKLHEKRLEAKTFRLSDKPGATIAPLLLAFGGKPRVDTRRVISGMLHRFRDWLRWRALPDVYDPRDTVFNRFNRWRERGLWQDIFVAVSHYNNPPLVGMRQLAVSPAPGCFIADKA